MAPRADHLAALLLRSPRRKSERLGFALAPARVRAAAACSPLVCPARGLSGERPEGVHPGRTEAAEVATLQSPRRGPASSHKNARSTPIGRERLMLPVKSGQAPPEAQASAGGRSGNNAPGSGRRTSGETAANSRDRTKLLMYLSFQGEKEAGGGSGIRTRDTVSRIHTFQACAFNRSATPPADRRTARRRPHAARRTIARNALGATAHWRGATRARAWADRRHAGWI